MDDVRSFALNKAIEFLSGDSQATSDVIVSTAARFEEYLNNGIVFEEPRRSYSDLR